MVGPLVQHGVEDEDRAPAKTDRLEDKAVVVYVPTGIAIGAVDTADWARGAEELELVVCLPGRGGGGSSSSSTNATRGGAALASIGGCGIISRASSCGWRWTTGVASLHAVSHSSFWSAVLHTCTYMIMMLRCPVRHGT